MAGRRSIDVVRGLAVAGLDGSRVPDEVKVVNPIVVIDNYDSFTYNLCQVCVFNGLRNRCLSRLCSSALIELLVLI